MGQLSDLIRSTVAEKLSFKNKAAQEQISLRDGAILALEDAADDVELVGAGDVTQGEIAVAAVALADVFDDSDKSQAQREKILAAVKGLIKTGTPEQIEKNVILFEKTLDYSLLTRGVNNYYDALLEADPDEPPPPPEIPSALRARLKAKK